MNYCITWHTEGASHGDLYASSQANHILPCNKETTYFDINKHQRDYEVIFDVWSASISYLLEWKIDTYIDPSEENGQNTQGFLK